MMLHTHSGTGTPRTSFIVLSLAGLLIPVRAFFTPHDAGERSSDGEAD
jgi:hypothetical protein